MAILINNNSYKIYGILIAIMVVISLIIQNKVIDNCGVKNLTINVNETDKFRQISLSEESIEQLKDYSEKEDLPIYKAITVLMIKNNYDLSKVRNFPDSEKIINEYKKINSKRPKEFQKLTESYKSIFNDAVYFPVAESDSNIDRTISYGNSWMAERLYGGKRGHEGCDIMAGINQRGLYPIVSVSDGIIEKLGWLEKGGWRIGIRSTSGAYYYYAHLAEYEKGMEIGKRVKAGEIIGYMGDSGYGEEGTVGKFSVHLHFGIYITTANHEELSVNPYWILKILEKNRILYSY